LRHGATSRKAAVSSPDEVEFFNVPNLSSRTMGLGSAQPLTEMSTGNLPGVNDGRRVRLTALPPSMSRSSRENVGASTSQLPYEPSRPATGITLRIYTRYVLSLATCYEGVTQLSAFENSYHGGVETQLTGENCVITNFIRFALHLLLLACLHKESEMGGTGGTHGNGKYMQNSCRHTEKTTPFWRPRTRLTANIEMYLTKFL
jgi:hypothetical protein